MPGFSRKVRTFIEVYMLEKEVYNDTRQSLKTENQWYVHSYIVAGR